jgi:ribose-phosphate pyrophosphokinase
LKIVGGSAGRVLAVLIARKLGLNASEAEIKRFPDGEKYLRVDDDVTGQDVVIVQSIHHTSDDLLFEYFLLCDTIRGLGASRIIGVLPYFAYARQDSQFNPGEAVSFRTVAKLIEDVGTSELFSVDMHRHRIGRVSDVFNIPVHNLTAAPLLAEYVRSNTPLERPVVIGPDEESEQWALAAAKAIGADHDVLQKKRLTAEKVQILTTRSLPVRGRDVLLIDDIISTGDTIVSASKMLKEQGARRVIIACTHPILAHDALARIYATGAEIVVGTDTVPSPISHVSVAPLIADALMRYSRSFPTLLEYVADGRS